MKFSKLILAAAITAGIINADSIVRAQVADGTYTFEATDGITNLDGSTVTFKADKLVSWDMVDATAQTLYSPGSASWYTTTLPLTPANSITGLTFDTENNVNTYQYDGVLGPNEWSFHILSTTLDVNFYDYFEAGNNVDTSGSSLGSLYDGFGDPHGNYILDLNNPASSVPDASGTLLLFVSAWAALGIGHKAFSQSGRLAFQRV